VVAQNQHNMIFVPSDDNKQTSNVPSGTCLDERCGLFSSLSLDDKMEGLQGELQRSTQQAANNSAHKLFTKQAGPNAFVLVAHGYVAASNANIVDVHEVAINTYHLLPIYTGA
jgi:hypothetical protein